MKTNTLVGLLVMLSAPFLGIDIFMSGMGVAGSEYKHTTLGGFFYVLYMSGWMLGIWQLYKTQATGVGRGRYVLLAQLVFLSIANLSNVYEIIYPDSANESAIYHTMDIFWPISNLTMIVTGICVLKAKAFGSWQRYVPLIVGLWIPSSIVAYFIIGETSRSFEIFVACYSIAAWSLFGFAIATVNAAPASRG